MITLFVVGKAHNIYVNYIVD